MSIEYTGFQNEMEPALRLVAMPGDTNPSGDIFGGWIMTGRSGRCSGRITEDSDQNCNCKSN